MYETRGIKYCREINTRIEPLWIAGRDKVVLRMPKGVYDTIKKDRVTSLCIVGDKFFSPFGMYRIKVIGEK